MPSALPRAGADLTLPKRLDDVPHPRARARRTSAARPAFLRGSAPAVGLSIALHGAVLLAGVRMPPGRVHAEAQPVAAVLVEEEAPATPPPPPPSPAEDVQANHVLAPAPLHAPPSGLSVHHDAHVVAAQPVAAPAPAMTSDDALPHFTIASSNVPPSAPTSAAAAVPTAPPAASSVDEAPVGEGFVDVPAHAKTKVRPTYPFEAQSSGLQGTVKLEIVLSTTGAVEDVRALTRLGHGFEAAAIAAARRTPFTPAMKAGRPVRVRMAWTVEFELQ